MSGRALGWAKDQQAPSMIAKAVLVCLADYADENACAWPSISRLAREVQVSERTVQRCLKALADAGLVVREDWNYPNGSTAPTRYHLQLRGVTGCRGATQQSPGGDTAVTGGVTLLSPHNEPPYEPSVASDDTGAAPDWVARLREARDLAADALDDTSPAVHHARDLRMLCEAEEPCTWGEVLDAIRAEAAKARTRGKRLRSWTWVRDTALQFRDRRLAGLPQPQAVNANERSRPDPRQAAFVDRLEAVDSAMAAAVQQFAGGRGA